MDRGLNLKDCVDSFRRHIFVILLVEQNGGELLVENHDILLLTGASVAVDNDGGVGAIAPRQVTPQCFQDMLFGDITALAVVGDAIFRELQFGGEDGLLVRKGEFQELAAVGFR